MIGHPPSNLVHPPSIVHLLPSQLEDAMTLSDGENPFILAAVYQEEASLYNVSQIEGGSCRGSRSMPIIPSASGRAGP